MSVNVAPVGVVTSAVHVDGVVSVRMVLDGGSNALKVARAMMTSPTLMAMGSMLVVMVVSAVDPVAISVSAVQRTSSDLKLNPHIHAVFLDGVFRERGTAAVG